MNLNAAVSGAVGAVQPRIRVTVKISTGSTTGPDGKRIPTYANPISLICQWQPVEYTDILMMGGMNTQGVRRRAYLNGEIDGLIRSKNKGGDLVIDPAGNVYKVAFISEQWENNFGPNWVCAIVTLQDDA